jgi:hypothetical protein
MATCEDSGGTGDLERDRFELEKRRVADDARAQLEQRTLERERLELDKYKAEQEAKSQGERIALDRERALREGRFGSNPALISAAISFAALLVTATQVWTAFISKDKELTVAREQKVKELGLAEEQSKRESDRHREEHDDQVRLDRAKFIAENRDALFGSDPGTRKRFSMVLETLYAKNVVEQLLGGDLGQQAAVPAASASASAVAHMPAAQPALQLAKAGGDGQTIPLGSWQNFAVRVSDANKRPVSGAKVAWQMPDRDAQFAYVGETDGSGISTATNMFTAAAPGAFVETATLVDRQTPVGFTSASNVKKHGAPERFTFEQK